MKIFCYICDGKNDFNSKLVYKTDVELEDDLNKVDEYMRSAYNVNEVVRTSKMYSDNRIAYILRFYKNH